MKKAGEIAIAKIRAETRERMVVHSEDRMRGVESTSRPSEPHLYVRPEAA
jgi:hypothetical protein